jgi:hypothetical protein
LAVITAAEDITRSVTPVMPASEASTEKASVVDEDDEDYEEPEDEEVEDGEEEEYDDAVDDIYAAIDGFINLIVSRLADKLKELNKDMEQNK